jgi:hypothetical protein
MICILGRADGRSTLPLRVISPVACEKKIPVVIDAAGLKPGRPDPWLSAGADLVIYSGGKYLRGPQSTGLLLGAKHLCQAAWINGAPHQAFGRPMKVGKEEIVGAVVALENWITRRDSRQEEEAWHIRLKALADRLTVLEGVTTHVLAAGASVSVPRLRITWSQRLLPVSAEGLRLRLLRSTPRVLIHDFWSTENSIVVDPFNLSDAEAIDAADAIANELAAFRVPQAARALHRSENVSGAWEVSISFLHGEASHRFELRQNDDLIWGRHFARGSSGQVAGSVAGRAVTLVACHEAIPMSLFYSFSGTLESDVLHGDLRVGACADEHNGPVFQGQFGSATWSAARTMQTARKDRSPVGTNER